MKIYVNNFLEENLLLDDIYNKIGNLNKGDIVKIKHRCYVVTDKYVDIDEEDGLVYSSEINIVVQRDSRYDLQFIRQLSTGSSE